MMLTNTEKEFILAYAKCDMNGKRTGRQLNYHYTNVYYHLDRIQEKTGLDPRKFYDLIKLLEGVNAK